LIKKLDEEEQAKADEESKYEEEDSNSSEEEEQQQQEGGEEEQSEEEQSEEVFSDVDEGHNSSGYGSSDYDSSGHDSSGYDSSGGYSSGYDSSGGYASISWGAGPSRRQLQLLNEIAEPNQSSGLVPGSSGSGEEAPISTSYLGGGDSYPGGSLLGSGPAGGSGWGGGIGWGGGSSGIRSREQVRGAPPGLGSDGQQLPNGQIIPYPALPDF
jgi:hypothetical protein